MAYLGALPSQQAAQALHTPDSVSPSPDARIIQPPRELVQLQPVAAHIPNLPQHILFFSQRHQQSPPVLIGVVAEAIAIRRRPEANPLRLHVM